MQKERYKNEIKYSFKYEIPGIEWMIFERFFISHFTLVPFNYDGY